METETSSHSAKNAKPRSGWLLKLWERYGLDLLALLGAALFGWAFVSYFAGL